MFFYVFNSNIKKKNLLISEQNTSRVMLKRVKEHLKVT